MKEKEGPCQQRSGCHLSVTVTAARAQKAAEHKNSHWIGFAHIPEALRHIPRTVVLTHPRSLHSSASLSVCFPGGCICFPPRKHYSSVPSQSCRPLQGEPEALHPQFMKLALHGQMPWKGDRAVQRAPHFSSVPNTSHLGCT